MCVGVHETKHRLCWSMTFWHLSYYTAHPHLKSIRCIWPQQSGNSRRTYMNYTHTAKHKTQYQTHLHKAGVWLIGVSHPPPWLIPHPWRPAFVRGNLRRDKAEYSVECKRKKAIDCSLRKRDICICTELLIWASHQSLMVKLRGAISLSALSVFYWSALIHH